MRHPPWTLTILTALLASLLVGCTQDRTPSPSLSPTAMPSLSPVATRAWTPAATFTPPPSPTTAPSPTPIPEPAQHVEKIKQVQQQSASLVSKGDPWSLCIGSGQKLTALTNYPSPGSVLGQFTLPGTVRDIWGSVPYTYVAVEGAGLWIVEPERGLSRGTGAPGQPLHPQALFVQDLCGLPSCTAGSGQVYVYLASPQEGLYVIDASDPHEPTVTGVYNELGITAVVVEHRYAYVIQGQAELQVLDIADPHAPQWIASVAITDAVDVALFDGIAYVVDRSGGITTVDVTDPSTPVVLATGYDLPRGFPTGEALRIVVDEGPWSNAGPRYAYLAMGEAGVRIVDVADPQIPRAAGFFDAAGPAGGIYVLSDSFYVAAGEEGLLRLRFVPAPTVTQYGPFSLQHLLYRYPPASFPAVQVPSWLHLDEDLEKGLLEQVVAAYAPLVGVKGNDKGLIQKHYGEVIVKADEFLGACPDGDGAIPVLMMLGSIHSFQIGWHWDRRPELLGQEYEQAITLLLQRHPERLSTILDDLIELGLPLSQAVSAQIDGRQVLFFAYNFSSPFGEPKGQIYTLMQQPDGSWSFIALPTEYGGLVHGARVQTIADINRDGQDEVVVRLEHAWASGTGLNVQVFSWLDGTWRNRIDGAGAFEGDYWLEDPDGDGVQEIVLRSRLSGGGPFRPYIYFFQWDTTADIYVDTLPVSTQVCGYHAYAEADRLRHGGNDAEADAWYQEAARRLRAEIAVAGSPCVQHFAASTVWDMIEVAEDPDHMR